MPASPPPDPPAATGSPPARAASGVAIEAEGLVKHFGPTRAVDGVDLTVPAGTVYGVLGPNGAGKTTAIRVLATLLRPDAGSARIFGHDVVTEADTVRGLVSLTGQFASVDEDLTGLENLILLARLWGYPRAAARARARDLLRAFGLDDAAERQVKTYSGGMRRRIDIAASIVVTPELVFLDEPTTGLDPRSRNHVWEIIRLLVAEGTTVLLTTQYLDEADQLADRIAVLDHGRVIAEGTSSQLKASVGGGTLHVRLLDPEQRELAERVLDRALGVPIRRDPDPAALSARVPTGASGGYGSNGAGAADQVARALSQLAHEGVAVANFALGQPSLDEVFLALTGRPAAPEAPGNGAASKAKEGSA
jgi:ABC-2 type transport system ATP-binding protein